jgi:hypothetical protein
MGDEPQLLTEQQKPNGSATNEAGSPAPTRTIEAKPSFTLSESLKRLGRPIAFYPGLAKRIGIEEAIFLQQMIYWTPRATIEGGGVYKSAVEWEEETSLTYRQQARVRRGLVGRGLLTEKYYRLEHRLYFQVIPEAIDQLFPACAPDETSDGKMTKRHLVPDERSDGDITKGREVPDERSSGDITGGGEAPDERSDRSSNIDYAETAAKTTQQDQIQNQPPLPRCSAGGAVQLVRV